MSESLQTPASRRTFLKRLALAAGGAVLVPLTTSCTKPERKTSNQDGEAQDQTQEPQTRYGDYPRHTDLEYHDSESSQDAETDIRDSENTTPTRTGGWTSRGGWCLATQQPTLKRARTS